MPTLNNPTDQDLYSPVIGEIVPACGSVEISDKQAEQVNTVSGVWVVTSSRITAKRGSKVAEQSAAPPMETR
ncbi:MAG TPA: hypothetical protein VFH54_17445 [Mycobacteriales bacterium]|nr:hypothetical protein [Mycobacteriales bacterium]